MQMNGVVHPLMYYFLTFSNYSFYNLRSTVKKSIVNDKPNSEFKSNTFSYFGMKTWN